MKREGAAGIPDPRVLANAFSEFISASTLLEASYRELQQKVGHLNVQLAERNAALTKSLAENVRMRAALQQTIDSMPCGVMVLNAAESVVTINPEAQRLLGSTSAGATTLRDLSRLTGIDFSGMFNHGESLHDAEVCIAERNEDRWLAVGKRALDSAPTDETLPRSSTQLHSIWIIRDITAGKRAAEEREAARRATALAEISTILAHEIRNPLASLELFASLLTEDGADNEQWISNLRAGIRTLSGTVNNVLSLNGETLPTLAALDLSSCAHGAVEFVRPIAEQAGVVLSMTPRPAPIRILGNEDGIRQIILNLACNAIRHTSAGGHIEVSTRLTTRGNARQALLEVRDTGCGISEEVMGQIFDAGFSRNGETPGLGLAVCRRLALQHGGAIHVTSCVGSGSTFQVEFPAI